MVEDYSFSASGSEREYRISSGITCDSSGVVYLLACKVCGKLYVSYYTKLTNDKINAKITREKN